MREYRSTLNLLARDRELASCVDRLLLCQFTPFLPETRESHLVNLEALANMVSVRTVILRGLVFCVAREQLEFGRILDETCPKLERLLWTDYFVTGPYPSWPANEFGGIRNLKSIEWVPRAKGEMLIHTILPLVTLTNMSLHIWNR
jgi:hypothetical protein